MLAVKPIEGLLLPVTDPELVIGAVAGDPRAFTDLYQRYVKRISSHVGRMLHSSSEREDVTQEVFLQVLLSLPRFEGRSSFYTWIYRLAANVVLHHLRTSSRRHRVARLDEGLEARLVRPYWLSGTNPERDADFNALQAETSRVIDRLTPPLRQVMLLGPVQGRSCEEVAGILGVRIEVVKARLHRARQSARTAMWRVERRGIRLAGPTAEPLIVVPSLVLN